MQMYVKNRLTGIPSVVDDHSVTSFVETPFFCNRSGDEKKMSDKLAVSRVHALNVRDMLIGHDQDVRRRLRIDVFERNCHLVAVYELCGDLAINDLTKYAVGIMAHGNILPQENRLKKQLCSPG